MSAMERFEAGDAQRRDAHGEVQESFQNNILANILGKTAQQGALVPYEGLEKTHEHVDELQLRLNLGHYVIGEMMQSQVSMALLWPMVQLRPGITVLEWTIERFQPGIAPIVAEEAPFPQQRFATQPMRTTLSRRGTSVYGTANVRNTPEGMSRIQSQLMKIAATVLNTFEYLMIMALLTAHNGRRYRDKIALDKYPGGQQTSEILRRQIEYDASRYAALHRDPEKQMATDMADVYRMLEPYAQPPYALLFPQGTQNILGGKTLDRPGRIDVKTIGPDRQVLTMESMPSYIQSPDGSLAFPVKDQGFGRRGDKIQPLLRTSMIAEHYAFSGMGRRDLAHRTGVQLFGDGYSTAQRNIRIYDVEVDEYVEVSFANAFLKSGFVSDRPDNRVLIDPNEYNEDSFYGEYRSAPPLYYWDREIRRATHFAQIDQNIISHTLHRNVGETAAAMVQVSKGDPSNALIEGMQLLEDLESAPYDTDFTRALSEEIIIPMVNVGNDFLGVPLDRVRQDIPFPNDMAENYFLMRQDIHGNLIGNADINSEGLMARFSGIIDRVGVPPYMANLAGLQLLVTLSKKAEISPRILEMGKIAKKFIDAAKRVYVSLKAVFPKAMAVNPYYRPIGLQQPNGFSTFFSAMFLNNMSTPLVVKSEDLVVITPFTVNPSQKAGLDGSPADILATDLETIGANVGSRATAIGQSIQMIEEDMNVPAHKKTPWTSMFDMLRRSRAMAGASAGGRRDRMRMEDEVGEADLFGTSRASTIPIGAGLPLQFRTRQTRTGYVRGDPVDPREEEPMNTVNAQNAWNEADRIENPLVRACTLTYLTSTCNSMEDFERMFQSDILVPFGMVLIRPGLIHNMYSLVVAKPGIDVAFHAVTDTEVMSGPEVKHQTFLLTFSVMHGVVMKSPDSVAILTSRMARRYIGGGGVRLFESPDQLSAPSGERPDLIPYVTPYEFTPFNYEPMGFIDVDGIYGKPGTARFAGAMEYEKIWQVSRSAVETRPYGNQWNTEPDQTPNVSWTGASLNYNRTLLTTSKGHRKGGSHPGCRSVWNGNEAVFPPPPRTEHA